MQLDPVIAKGIGRKVTRWLLFTVGLSLAPFLIDYLALIRASHGAVPPLDSIIDHGELCLVCTALAGVGAGELFGVGNDDSFLELVLGWCCLASAIVSICLYIFMKPFFDPTEAPLLTGVTWWVFAETLISSTLAIAVSELHK